MKTRLQGWMVPVLLGGTMGYCIAEEITLTTYYPSPRGVYNELRTLGDVRLGDLSAEPPKARLHVVQEAATAALRVDDEAPFGLLYDTTPFVIDQAGNVGIGTASPGNKLDVAGAITATGGNAVTGANRATLDVQPGGIARVISLGPDTTTRGGVRLAQAASDGTSYLDTLSVNSAGNVGIGTTTPTTRLQVRDGANTNIRMAAGSSILGGATGFGIQSVNDAGTTVQMLVLDGDPTSIPRGNVGIGTTTPNPSAPNSQAGNIDANDVWLRSAGRWASQTSGATIDYSDVGIYAFGGECGSPYPAGVARNNGIRSCPDGYVLIGFSGAGCGNGNEHYDGLCARLR